MGHLYFDESIRNAGNFIIGAAVYSRADLSQQVHGLWRSLGQDPTTFEYKSRTLKNGDSIALEHRNHLHRLLLSSKLAFVVCPSHDRQMLGRHAISLTRQLVATGSIEAAPHTLYLDENIALSEPERTAASKDGVLVMPQQNSKIVAGLQVADLAAHSLGGMLLEEMGVLRKVVRAGENSGYDPETQIELGFELWASLRYSIICYGEPVGPDEDPVGTSTLRVDGYGLYIAPSCSTELAAFSRSRFGTNYLGASTKDATLRRTPMPGDKNLQPLAEMALISEIVTQSKFAERAADRLAKATDSVEIWGSIQSLLVAAANVSKILWPTKKQYKARGKQLRERLGVDDNNVLSDRTFRNHFEHYDERIEDWFENYNSAVYMDSRIEPFEPTPLSFQQFSHRSYYPTSRTLSFRNESIDLSAVLTALAKIREKCRPFALP